MSSNSVLKQTLAPVVLVVAFWVTVSSSTTYYLLWEERSNQRVFVENISSMRAAASLQYLIWKIATEYPEDVTSIPGFRLQWKEAEIQIANERKMLLQSAFTEPERRILLKMDSFFTQFVECLSVDSEPETVESMQAFSPAELATKRRQAVEFARKIASSANDLFKINQELADQDAFNRQRINRVVVWTRLASIVVGPILGVLLGLRLATRLNRSIAKIAVTLRDVDSKSESDVGTVNIEAFGDFHDVEKQADRVAERMRQVSHDLQIARREVLQSERLAAVGELAAGVAHEIRNPLTSIKLLLQHAIHQASGPILDESKLRLILEEIGRMETTIQGLLDFSRPPRFNRVTHDLRQTLRRALNLLDARTRQQKVEIILNIAETPLMVEGDSERIHQVFVNLLINAVEAMPDGGRLSIDAAIEAIPNPHNPSQSSLGQSKVMANHVVKIVIQDTGEGIANEVLSRLFEPFATTKERGTGLGLAVSRRIIEEHFGTINACNRTSGGAQFTVTIPAVESTVGMLAS